jgi:hypothetical protein
MVPPLRIMTEDSKGWIRPKIQTMSILGETEVQERSEILCIIPDGVRKYYIAWDFTA